MQKSTIKFSSTQVGVAGTSSYGNYSIYTAPLTILEKFVQEIGEDNFEILNLSGSDDENITIINGTHTYTLPKNKVSLICPKGKGESFGILFYLRYSSYTYYLECAIYRNGEISYLNYVGIIFSSNNTTSMNDCLKAGIDICKISPLTFYIKCNYGSSSYFALCECQDWSNNSNDTELGVFILSGSSLCFCSETKGYESTTLSVGSVNGSYLGYIGLQKIVFPNHGYVINDVYSTTHRSSSVQHIITLNGEQYLSTESSNSYAQIYFKIS